MWAHFGTFLGVRSIAPVPTETHFLRRFLTDAVGLDDLGRTEIGPPTQVSVEACLLRPVKPGIMDGHASTCTSWLCGLKKNSTQVNPCPARSAHGSGAGDHSSGSLRSHLALLLQRAAVHAAAAEARDDEDPGEHVLLPHHRSRRGLGQAAQGPGRQGVK